MVIGEHLQSRYRLDQRLASGGMGTVYIATDEKLDRRVAVKILKEDLAKDARFVERFRREARSAAALSHPNIAGVFDYGEDSGRYFIVMELVNGRDLAAILDQEGPLAWPEATLAARQIASALAHAHAAGLVHRDVKPANVIVTDDGRVKVTDFGIARAMGESTLTATGSLMGTASYISPEQAQGLPATSASDVYGLGVVMYEMLTGQAPFSGESLVGVAMRHISEEIPAPSERVSEIPKQLDDVVARATKKGPNERPSAPQLESELAALSRGDLETVALAAAVQPTAELTPTVWPIPGRRWDPVRLGRTVVLVFATLTVIAASLLVVRVVSDEEPLAAGRTNAQTQPAPETSSTPAGAAMPNLIGVQSEEAANEIQSLNEDQGLGLTLQLLPATDEICDALTEPNTVACSDPPPDAALLPSATVTLYVSSEEENDEEDEDSDEEDHPGKGNGRDKGKDKDD